MTDPLAILLVVFVVIMSWACVTVSAFILIDRRIRRKEWR